MRLFGGILCLLALLTGVAAQTGSQKTAAQLNTEVNTQFPDQTSGQITPFNLRQVTLDMIASSVGLSPFTGTTTPNNFGCVGPGSPVTLIDCGLSSTATNNWSGIQNFNGGATAPTRTVGDSTTNLATTAFVAAALPALTIANGKTLTVNNTLTLSGVDGTTLTFQGTDTYVGRATIDTLTNKTFNTAATGNVFQINGTGITSLGGNTGKVGTVAGTLTAGNCVSIDANLNFVDAGGACTTGGGGGTVSAGTSGQLAYYGSSGTVVTGNANMTISAGQLTLGIAGSVQGSLRLAGSAAGNTTLAAASTGGGTLTLPAGTDTLVGRATTDTFTNKTYNTAATGNVFQIGGTTISSISGNTSKVGTVSGALTAGDCVVADASSNLIDCGGAPVFNSMGNYFYGQTYGMKCDGSTNDVTAFNNLMTAALAATGGGIAILPAGDCVMPSTPSTLTVACARGLTLQGAGKAVTTLRFTGGTDGIDIDYTANTTHICKSLTLRDFAVTTTQAAGNGIKITGPGISNAGDTVARTIIERIFANNDNNTLHYWTTGLNLNCVSYVYVTKFDFQGGDVAHSTGIFGGNNSGCLTKNVVQILIDDANINVANIGIDIEGSSASGGSTQGIWVTKSNIVAVNICLRLNHASGQGVQATIADNWCDSATTGMQLLNFNTLMVHHNGFIVEGATAPFLGINCTPCILGDFTGNRFANGTSSSTNQTYMFFSNDTTTANNIVSANTFINGATAIDFASTGGTTPAANNNAAFGNRCVSTSVCVSDAAGTNRTCQVGSSSAACQAAITNQ